MGVFGAGIDVQLAHLLAAQRVAGNHPLDGLDQDAFGVITIEDLGGGAMFDAAGMPGVPVIQLIGTLAPGHLNFFGIDNDDIVAAIHMGGERRFVLAAQSRGYDAGEPAEDNIFGIYQAPLPVDFRGLGGIGFHIYVRHFKQIQCDTVQTTRP